MSGIGAWWLINRVAPQGQSSSGQADVSEEKDNG